MMGISTGRCIALLVAAALAMSCAAMRQSPETEQSQVGRVLPMRESSGTTVHGPQSGHLLIIGGGEIPPVIWDSFAEQAGGPEARVVVITNASGAQGAYDGPAFEEIARRVGEDNVVEMHLEDIVQANDPAMTAPLEQATGVFFTGGRQWRIAEVYLNTRAHALLNELLERGGVIAGTSAGASIQGSFLWRGDTSGHQITVGDHTQGLGFMKRTAIDQHIIARGREADLQAFIKASPGYLGIGIDESTAILVEGDSLTVTGQSRVAVHTPESSGILWLYPGDRYDMSSGGK